MTLSAGHGYTVHRNGPDGWITSLRCQICGFTVALYDHRRTSDRSGLPKYNRARAAMLRHHRDAHKAAGGGA